MKGLKNWGIITLRTNYTDNDENDDVVLRIFLIKARISENILCTLYDDMRTSDKQTSQYYIVHKLQKEKFMEGYETPIKAYVDEMCMM